MRRNSPSSWSASERAALVALSAALALVAGCGSSPRAVRPGTLSARRHGSVTRDSHPSCAELLPTEGPRVCALARLDADAGTMEVRLRLEPDALPSDRREVRLRFRETLGAHYAEDFVAVRGGAGWPESLGALVEPVELEYVVTLEALDAPRTDEARADEARADGARPHDDSPRSRAGTSWRRPNGWRLTGRSFLPDVWVDGESVEVPATLVLDVGERPLFTSAGTEPHQFDARSLIRLADESYEVGPLSVARRDVGSTTLWVATSSEGGEPVAELLADAIARAFGVLDARLGAPSTDSLLFTHHEVADAPEWGERLGTSLVGLTAGPMSRDPLYGLPSSAVHELGHVWIPGSHVVEEEWLEEGVDDYLAVEVMAALVEAPPEATARVVLRTWARYAAGAGERTLREPSDADPRWAYDAGLVAGFCLDAHLRESGSSLPAVLRHTLAREEAAVGTEALLEDLAAVSASAASYLEALLMTRGAFAIDECLERRGFHVREVRHEAWSDRALAEEILGATRSRAFAKVEALEVQETTASSPLEPGDVVLRVSGHPVAELADVAFALRDAAEGERFAIELRRQGEDRTIEHTVPELEDDARAERTYLELVPIER